MTIQRSENGLYVVDWRYDFVPWLQWRTWNFEQLRLTSAPQRMTTKLVGPPETQEGADLVREFHIEMRAEIDKESKRMDARGWRTLPRPAPFVPWRPIFMTRLDELEAARRKLDGASFFAVPAYSFDPTKVLRMLKERAESITLARGAGIEHPYREPVRPVDEELAF